MVEQPQPQQVGIKGRPVSSIEEVRATSIDFDGSVFFFPDIANKRIYTKQINLDGTSTLNVYELKNIPIEQPAINPSQYVTREEFEATLSQFKQLLTQQVPVVMTQPQQTVAQQSTEPQPQQQKSSQKIDIPNF